MAFPPLKGGNAKPIKVYEGDNVSTGSGGLKKSIAVKNAGVKPSPGIEKTNSAS